MLGVHVCLALAVTAAWSNAPRAHHVSMRTRPAVMSAADRPSGADVSTAAVTADSPTESVPPLADSKPVAESQPPAESQPVADTLADFKAAAEKANVPSGPKAELMAGLRREYGSFFQPMEDNLYNPAVTFEDPLIALSGVDAYKNNVNMLAGKTLMGMLCFSDCGLNMHNLTETADGGLESRWTLQFRFKLLPWQPVARFTGVSRYTLDDSCRVLRQQDYWDSINLNRGKYAPVEKSEALKDLLGQLAPGGVGSAQQSSDKELPYELLRRAKPRGGLPGYEVRRYPQHVSVATEYYRRIEAFGTLGAYTNGANEASLELKAYVPSLVSVPYDKRTLSQINNDALDLKPPEVTKTMRWPLAVPAMKEPAPPKPTGRLEGFAELNLMPSRTVAVLAFADPTTEPNVRGFHGLLESYLKEDGLKPAEGEQEEQFRLAQFDALNSLGARRSEIWIDLADDNPW